MRTKKSLIKAKSPQFAVRQREPYITDESEARLPHGMEMRSIKTTVPYKIPSLASARAMLKKIRTQFPELWEEKGPKRARMAYLRKRAEIAGQ